MYLRGGGESVQYDLFQYHTIVLWFSVNTYLKQKKHQTYYYEILDILDIIIIIMNQQK